MTRYTVMLCCNDERGNMLRRVEQVVVGDQLIHLESVTERGLGLSIDRDLIRVSRRYFRCRDHATCVGNLFWDAVTMEEDSALLLVEYLIERGWTVTEYADEGPFAKYGRKAVVS